MNSNTFNPLYPRWHRHGVFSEPLYSMPDDLFIIAGFYLLLHVFHSDLCRTYAATRRIYSLFLLFVTAQCQMKLDSKIDAIIDLLNILMITDNNFHLVLDENSKISIFFIGLQKK